MSNASKSWRRSVGIYGLKLLKEAIRKNIWCIKCSEEKLRARKLIEVLRNNLRGFM